MAETKTVRLSDLLPVMGDAAPDARISVRLLRGRCEAAETSSAEAAARYGAAAVLRCIPKGDPEGSPDTSTYLIDAAPYGFSGYIPNPKPIPAFVQSWRAGDEAWFFPTNLHEPVLGRIRSISRLGGPDAPASLCLEAGGDTWSRVPADALFLTRGNAVEAARNGGR